MEKNKALDAAMAQIERAFGKVLTENTTENSARTK